ncbi:hypothetical protein EYZ11_005586 [Aspergillus tanneri]|uniref:Uncharacterized protein n=1 Tax=Aspergillus tanneri TaxID=1220188 RepID=A0A4S3JJZ9_9EURO|nr:hypothetical protein EYZ11_005586 [Aspergillus tanneri]
MLHLRARARDPMDSALLDDILDINQLDPVKSLISPLAPHNPQVYPPIRPQNQQVTPPVHQPWFLTPDSWTSCRWGRTPSRPLASCSARTPASEGIVCRILETRATALVKDYGPEQEGELTCLDHVGRVQALLVYSTIRLFDYDIRQRCLAEQLPTLYSWSHAMLGRAA